MTWKYCKIDISGFQIETIASHIFMILGCHIFLANNFCKIVCGIPHYFLTVVCFPENIHIKYSVNKQCKQHTHTHIYIYTHTYAFISGKKFGTSVYDAE
jgi:hypothetical protein